MLEPHRPALGADVGPVLRTRSGLAHLFVAACPRTPHCDKELLRPRERGNPHTTRKAQAPTPSGSSEPSRKAVLDRPLLSARSPRTAWRAVRDPQVSSSTLSGATPQLQTLHQTMPGAMHSKAMGWRRASGPSRRLISRTCTFPSHLRTSARNAPRRKRGLPLLAPGSRHRQAESACRSARLRLSRDWSFNWYQRSWQRTAVPGLPPPARPKSVE
mmetsp:Transcript_16287/g.61764  ORF Transcript_16287/g.61764 Transcript_16287/m.61764 type:complete len:215 (+) Transcript_16287:1432-2076(+)